MDAYRIRPYDEPDAAAVGRLIADTYSRFNLSFASGEELARLLGPFRHARSTDLEHCAAIARTIRAPVVLVAEVCGEIAGVLRGRRERLASLFVHAHYQQRGIGRQLVAELERQSAADGVGVIRLAATLYAVPFYTALGYRKSSGVRNAWSFGGTGLVYQPMKKVLLPLPEREAAAPVNPLPPQTQPAAVP